MTRELMQDIRDYHQMKQNIRVTAQNWLDHNYALLKVAGFDGFERLMEQIQYMRNFIDPDPVVFKTKEDFDQFVSQPDYERSDELPGMCFAILIDENISNPNTTAENQRINIEIIAEGQRGKTPAGVGIQTATSQQIIPNTGSPSFDKYSKNPNARSAEMYVRQGFAWIQNWAINAAFRQLTNETKARIEMSVVPFNVHEVVKDEFEQVMKGIYSYISLVIYVLPMYTYILRMQIEKQ